MIPNCEIGRLKAVDLLGSSKELCCNYKLWNLRFAGQVKSSAGTQNCETGKLEAWDLVCCSWKLCHNSKLWNWKLKISQAEAISLNLETGKLGNWSLSELSLELQAGKLENWKLELGQAVAWASNCETGKLETVVLQSCGLSFKLWNWKTGNWSLAELRLQLQTVKLANWKL